MECPKCKKKMAQAEQYPYKIWRCSTCKFKAWKDQNTKLIRKTNISKK